MTASSFAVLLDYFMTLQYFMTNKGSYVHFTLGERPSMTSEIFFLLKKGEDEENSSVSVTSKT